MSATASWREQGLDWNQVYDACQAMSLFSGPPDHRAGAARQGRQGSRRPHQRHWQTAPPRPAAGAERNRLNQTQMKAAWFGQAEPERHLCAGQPPEPRFFPRWMSARFQRFGLGRCRMRSTSCATPTRATRWPKPEIEKLTPALAAPAHQRRLSAGDHHPPRPLHPFQLVDTLLEGETGRIGPSASCWPCAPRA